MKSKLMFFALLLAPLASVYAAGVPAKPNVLFILCDDIRWNAMSCAGHPTIKTPNIDRIANEGVRFANMFCTTSLCSPSRASILTGLYAHTHGVTNNFTELPAARPHWAQRLHDEGYTTAYMGKWHVGEDNDLKQPVLIIKTARGGKSLNVDFRPPSAAAARGGVVGPYYKALIEYTRDCVSNLDTEFPEWKGKGYHIAGIGWHQGWNDRVDKVASANYEANLVDLIKDLRAEFGNPKLPVSITTTSMAPPPERIAVELAQLAVADPKKYPAFDGNVKTTDARPFWRDASVSPSNFGYHWNHNGESEYLNGKAMGERMAEMLGR